MMQLMEAMPNTFRDRLKSAREALRLSQEALADRLGVSRVTVLGWEKGVGPTRKRVPEIAAALGVSVAWMYGQEGGVGPQADIGQPAGDEGEGGYSMADAPEFDWRQVLQTMADAMREQAEANRRQAAANEAQATANKQAWDEVHRLLGGDPRQDGSSREGTPAQEQAAARDAV